MTQLVFCDLSTPKNDGTFSVYNDLRDKLIARGIPAEEIAFVHDANNEAQKKELFAKVRRAKSVCCSVPRREWAQGQMYRIG